MYASVFDNGKWKIRESNDYGDSWADMSEQPEQLQLDENDLRNYNFTIEVSKAKPNFIYCATRNNDTVNLYYFDQYQGNGEWITIGSHDDGNNRFGGGHGFGVNQSTGEEIYISY